MTNSSDGAPSRGVNGLQSAIISRRANDENCEGVGLYRVLTFVIVRAAGTEYRKSTTVTLHLTAGLASGYTGVARASAWEFAPEDEEEYQ
jgi:hypothetical protein